jgi:hypothetical protein
MQQKLPAYQQESFQSRVHGLGYQKIQGYSSSKKDMDDAFMFRRRTHNVYSNDHIVPKHSNAVSMASLKHGSIPVAFQSSEDLEALKQMKKTERRQINF